MAKIKKTLFLSLIIAIVVAVCPGHFAPVLAAANEIIADFTDGITAEEMKLESSAEETLNGEYAAKWVVSKPKQTGVYENVPTDWTQHDTFEMWIYSENASNSKINILVNTGNSNRSYFLAFLKLDFAGWKNVKIPLSDFMPQYSATWDAGVTGIQLNVNGWNNTAGYEPWESITNPLYIDSMWISTAAEEDVENPVYDETQDGIYTLADFSSEEAVTSVGSALVPDYEVKNIYDLSAKWADHPTNNVFSFTMEPTDFVDYKTINMNVYSAVANNATINLIMYTAEPANAYRWLQFKTDFEGWKTLSLNLSAGTSSYGGDYTDIHTISFYASGWSVTANPTTVLNFEKIWFSKGSLKPFEFTNGGGNVDMEAPFEMEFSGILPKVINKNLISIECTSPDGTEQVTDFEATSFGKKLIINMNKKFESTYKISLADDFCDTFGQKIGENKTASFVTGGKALITSVPVFKNKADIEIDSLPSGGNLISSVSVTNPFDGEKEVVFYTCLYGENGEMELCETAPYTLLPQETVPLTNTISSSYKGKTAAAFVTADGIPVGKAVYMKHGETAKRLAKPASNVKELETEIYVDEITISGASDGDFALITIDNKDGNTVLITPVVTDKEGNFETKLKLPDESGNCVVKAYNKDAEFYYPTTEEYNSALGGINGEADLDDFAVILGIDADEAEAIDEIIMLNKPYSDIASLTDAKNKALALFEEINGCDWSEILNIMNNNANFLGFEGISDSYAENEIENAMAAERPFADFDAAKKAFAEAKEAYDEKQEETEEPSSGGGWGGGGSGGGSKLSITPVVAPVLKPEILPVITEKYEFSDLGGFDWAKDSIYALTEKGIISKPESKEFIPGGNITREQFVKMLVCAFGEVDTSAECSFEDVDKTAWYYPYIATAEKLGIAKGSDGKFGIGSNITRQDIAVMALRASELQAKTADEVFADDADIADYAKEAVYTMKFLGIISGMGDGNFAPYQVATRAQAAKIMYGLILAE